MGSGPPAADIMLTPGGIKEWRGASGCCEVRVQPRSGRDVPPVQFREETNTLPITSPY